MRESCGMWRNALRKLEKAISHPHAAWCLQTFLILETAGEACAGGLALVEALLKVGNSVQQGAGPRSALQFVAQWGELGGYQIGGRAY